MQISRAGQINGHHQEFPLFSNTVPSHCYGTLVLPSFRSLAEAACESNALLFQINQELICAKLEDSINLSKLSWDLRSC